MEKRVLGLVIMLAVSFVGCGQKVNPSNDVPAESNEASVESEDASLSYLMDHCTGIYLEYDFSVEHNNSSGDMYCLVIRDDVAEFESYMTSEGVREERRADYTTAKFDEVRNLIKESKPKIYDINEHADENGRIVYETLNPAIRVFGYASDHTSMNYYLLEIEDTSNVEEFFHSLMESSDVTNTSQVSQSGDTTYSYYVEQEQEADGVDSYSKSTTTSTNGVAGSPGMDSNDDTTYVISESSSESSSSDAVWDYLPSETITTDGR